jgi:4-amino-4-deoxy-L-arabinose transferase-like glycosyltransferase
VHFLTLHGWIKLFGATELSVRLLSSLAGVVTLIVGYTCTRVIANKEAGLWTMFFMTSSTLFLYHQTEARMYSLVALFAFLSIYCFWKWFESKSSLRWGVFYTLSAILLVHTHVTALVLPAAFFLFWLIEERRHKWKNWQFFFVSNLLIFGSFAVWAIPVFLNKAEAGNNLNGWFFSQADGGYFFTHLTNFFLIGETHVVMRSLMAFLSIILLWLSLFSIERPGWWQKIKSIFDHDRWPVTVVAKWSKEQRFLLTLFFFPMAVGFIFQVTVTKYLLVAGLGLFLLLAAGISRQKGILKAMIFAAMLLLVVPMHLRLYVEKRHHWDEAAQKIRELTQKEDMAVLAHSFAWELPMRFYADDSVKILPVYPFDDQLTQDERIIRYNWQGIVTRDNVELVGGFVENHQKVILISSTPEHLEADPVKSWFWSHGWKLERRHTWPGYGDPEILIFEKTD